MDEIRETARALARSSFAAKAALSRSVVKMRTADGLRRRSFCQTLKG